MEPYRRASRKSLGLVAKDAATLLKLNFVTRQASTETGLTRPRVSSPLQHRETSLGLRNFCFQPSQCRRLSTAALRTKTQSPPSFSTFDEEEAFLSVSEVEIPYQPSSARTRLDGELDLEASDTLGSSAFVHDPTRYQARRRAAPHSRKPVEEKEDTLSTAKLEVLPLSTSDPYFAHTEEYKQHFLPAINAEMMESEAVVKERLSTWPLRKLEKEGYCLTGMRGRWLSTTTFGRPTASFTIGPGIEFPEHKFDQGSHVLVSLKDPLVEEPFRGTVVGQGPTHLNICFPENFALQDERKQFKLWRLDLGKTTIVFERMRDAIQALKSDPPASSSNMLVRGTYLRRVLLKSFCPDGEEQPTVPLDDLEDLDNLERIEVYGHSGAFSKNEKIQSWVKRYSLPVPLIQQGDMPLPGMNPSQIRAIATMLGNPLSLVQGPPGTGKTKTILETLKLLKRHFRVSDPILVCTYTNVAVDNLVEGLADAGMKPLRVGYVGSVRKSLLEHTLQTQLEKHRLYPKWTKLNKDLEGLQTKYIKTSEDIKDYEKKSGAKASRLMNMRGGRESIWKQIRAVDMKAKAMYRQMLLDVIAAADVICTTCITAASFHLHVTNFPVVFLDEASMATEPVSLVPLMKGSKHVALIGDHKQLPPVIVSKEAQSLGLGVSLFERLTKEGVVPSVMLDVQYRMHPDIANFPSNEFYLGSLRDGTVDERGKVLAKLSPPQSGYLDLNLAKLKAVNEEEEGGATRPSVLFLDHSGNEAMKDKSRVNLAEADIIAGVVVDLLLANPDLRGKDIGIIAPYVAQISLLTRMLNTDTRYQERFRKILGDTLTNELASVEIKTVDGFEGREKEVIVFSTVRNNSGGNIGFLADKRRLNVGLTRAKRALFVIGNIETLSNGKVSGGTVNGDKGKGTVKVGKGAESWRRYAKYLSERGLVVRVDGQVLRQALMGEISSVPEGSVVPKSIAELVEV